MAGVIDFLFREFSVSKGSITLINIVIAVIFLALGILIGRIVKFVLTKISDKAELEKSVKYSFLKLFLVVAEWSVYILFLNISLRQLGIPQLTGWITSILIVIPALVGALLLIAIGFVIATYLRDIVEESKVLNWSILSKTVFYFTLYVFMVFALKTALFSLDSNTMNVILIILTAVISTGFAYRWARKKDR